MNNLIETFSLSLFLRSRIQVKKVNLINIDMMTDCSVVFCIWVWVGRRNRKHVRKRKWKFDVEIFTPFCVKMIKIWTFLSSSLSFVSWPFQCKVFASVVEDPPKDFP